MFSLFKRKKAAPACDANVLFQEKGIIEVTDFKAKSPGDALGYICGCKVCVFRDGTIKAFSDDDAQQELESFSLRNLFNACGNINNYDPRFAAEVSLMTREKDYRFVFKTVELKKEFWDVLVKTEEMLRQQPTAAERAEEQPGPAEPKRYTGFCCSTTGWFGHAFRDENGGMFSVGGPTVSLPDIALKGFGKELWCKAVDFELTLAPGIRREITDEAGNCCGAYICSGFDSMYIQMGNRQLTAAVTESGWSFTIDSEEAARITRLPDEQRTRSSEDGLDSVKAYSAEVSEMLDPQWYPLILAAPMLGFSPVRIGSRPAGKIWRNQ